ncbi:hypothetical protein MMC24_000733 [Lignoscripta atroalba]|nr:hypothetical protein [Lignoscripta atroalba]
MSPSAVRNSTANDHFKDDLQLSIVGLGVEYPPHRVGAHDLETVAERFYPHPQSTALKKVLSINRYTGIETRASVGSVDHPLVNSPTPPTITQLNKAFREDGVRLSVSACRKALKEWGGSVDDITHVVSTTCTNSANPGFDHFVTKELGLRKGVEKVLLHGIGCSGGLAAIRTAANMALGMSHRQKPARILVLACELSTLLIRSELDSIDKNQEVRIGVCLFSDCASSVIISNGIGDAPSSEPVYEILGWKHELLDDTEDDLGFDVDPMGKYSCWKVVLSPRVPGLAAAAVAPAFQDLLKSLPKFHKGAIPATAADFDWALHPGGSTIITGVEQAMNLTPEHLRASYEVYINYGNSSSATVISVLDKLRNMEDQGRENAVACAFGPGIILEMMILKKRSALESLPREDLD